MRFVVIRDKVQTDVTVTTVESNVQSDVPVVGITLATGYRYDPRSLSISGSRSAARALAWCSLWQLRQDHRWSAAGWAPRCGHRKDHSQWRCPSHRRHQEKISAAQKSGATAFFVPASNCRDLDGVRTTMTLIKVATLSEAIKAVQVLNSSGDNPRLRTADEPSCELGRFGIASRFRNTRIR